MKQTKRFYSGKKVEMLFASSAIVEQAINHKDFLITKRVVWADPYFPDLQKRIQDAFTNYLGIDNAKELRVATQLVVGVAKNAIRDLAEFKVQITEDFKHNKIRLNEILTNLGFVQHHLAARRNDHESLTELLLQFKKNMTTEMQTEITGYGTSASLITSIIGYADVLKASNITQQIWKGSRKEVSQAGINELNEIYSQVISVAKISAKFFRDDKAKKQEFSFSKAIKNMNNARNSSLKEAGVGLALTTANF